MSVSSWSTSTPKGVDMATRAPLHAAQARMTPITHRMRQHNALPSPLPSASKLQEETRASNERGKGNKGQRGRSLRRGSIISTCQSPFEIVWLEREWLVDEEPLRDLITRRKEAGERGQ